MGRYLEKIYTNEAELPPLATETSDKLRLPSDKIIDWPSIFEEHKSRLEEEEKERKRRIKKKEDQEKSWELAKLCREYIRDNSKKWTGEIEDKRKKREKEIAKKERKSLAREKKENTMKNLVQKKIIASTSNLSKEDKKKIFEIEDRKRRLELKEMKENLWRWREKKPGKKKESAKEEKKTRKELEDRLRLIEEKIEERKRLEDKKEEDKKTE